MNSLNINTDPTVAWLFCLTVLSFAAIILLPDTAMAALGEGDHPIEEALCEVVGWFRGPIGRAVGTLAIIIIGILALMGKVSWGLAIMVVLGIALVFGAPALLTLIAADNAPGGGADCGGPA